MERPRRRALALQRPAAPTAYDHLRGHKLGVRRPEEWGVVLGGKIGRFLHLRAKRERQLHEYIFNIMQP